MFFDEKGFFPYTVDKEGDERMFFRFFCYG